MTVPRAAPIVIIGGGVMGASTLYHLAKRNQPAVLLEKEAFFGLGATGRCAGGVRYQFATEINVRLSLLSVPMLDRFEEEIGQPIDRRYCGYLFLLTTDAEVASFKRNVALQKSLGVQTDWLSGEEVRCRLPLIHCPDVLAGTFNSQDGLCDPNGVVMGYINAARRLGGQALEGVEVTAIQTTGSRVSGVTTNQGTINCECVVMAAGPWSAPISRTAGIELPITPLRRRLFAALIVTSRIVSATSAPRFNSATRFSRAANTAISKRARDRAGKPRRCRKMCRDVACATSLHIYPTFTTTAIAVSPAAQPVNNPYPPPISASSSINSITRRIPVGPWG
jgi:glycine/D-amino acid oxidase-like deaminating enzyme